MVASSISIFGDPIIHEVNGKLNEKKKDCEKRSLFTALPGRAASAASGGMDGSLILIYRDGGSMVLWNRIGLKFLIF